MTIDTYIKALESAIDAAYKYIDTVPEPDTANRRISQIFEACVVTRMLLTRAQQERLGAELQKENEWQDIVSAPKDGSKVFLYDINRKHAYTGHWEIQKYHKNPKPYWEKDGCGSDIQYQRIFPPRYWKKIEPPKGI